MFSPLRTIAHFKQLAGNPMRKKRIKPTGTRVADTLQQPSVSTTSGSRSAPKLPHERDESVAAPAPPDKQIVQAHRDLARGLQDTDRYNEARKVFALARKR